jgi:BirA family transcriptional regulator, biotin operon repressor / biotin---[acetyl-CoA-carboxylase] ligase
MRHDDSGAAAGPVRTPEAAGRAAFAGFRLRRLARTASTQDSVRAAARAGAEPGHCVVAAEQTAGRGRQGRTWSAPPGSALLMSILVRPASPGGLPLVAGLAVADAVAACSGVEVALKWPNDVLAGAPPAKLAGILAEVEPLAPRGPAPAVALGIGVNLAVDAFPAGVEGASLHRLVAPAAPPPADTLLAALLEALGERLARLDREGLAAQLPEWRARAAGLGAAVTAVSAAGTVSGVAVDVDEQGALLVEAPSGVVRLLAGDVHLGPGAGPGVTGR